MNDFVLVASDEPSAIDGEVRLSLSAGNGSEIEWLPNFFESWRPTAAGEALLALAMATSTIDKVVPRDETTDAWTRELHLRAPAGSGFEPEHYDSPLSFLTGDRWQLKGYPTSAPLYPIESLNELALDQALSADAVSLFSGGLDSLVGVIDYLERHPDRVLALVAHYDGGQASSRQEELWEKLAAQYGADRIPLRRLWARPGASSTEGNLAPLETTTRGRSFLFIAAATALADSIGPATSVIVPENGYIALNVPLTRARSGSLSTRTTHPHYLGLLEAANRSNGITNPIGNPYIFKTKGEMLAESLNRELLEALTPLSVSCSHPEVARWSGLAQGNCGYCFPCIIRQASMHAAGFARDSYSWDVLEGGEFLDEQKGRGADLRAVLNGVFGTRPDRDVLRNGPLPGNREQHVSTWRRGNEELATWLMHSAHGGLEAVVSRLARNAR